MDLPKNLQGEWTIRGRRLLEQILRREPEHERISFDWICRLLSTGRHQLQMALTDRGEIGQKLVDRYMGYLESMGYPIMVVFETSEKLHGVFVTNETQHRMEVICRGVGRRAFVWSTGSGD